MLLSQRDTALVDIVYTQLWDDLCESLEHGFDEPRVCSFLRTLCSLPVPFDRLSFTLHTYFFNFSTNKVIRKYLPPTTYTSLVFYTHDRLITNLSITNTFFVLLQHRSTQLFIIWALVLNKFTSTEEIFKRVFLPIITCIKIKVHLS